MKIGIIELRAMKHVLIEKLKANCSLEEKLRTIHDINIINIKIEYHEGDKTATRIGRNSREMELPRGTIKEHYKRW